MASASKATSTAGHASGAREAQVEKLELLDGGAVGPKPVPRAAQRSGACRHLLELHQRDGRLVARAAAVNEDVVGPVQPGMRGVEQVEVFGRGKQLARIPRRGNGRRIEEQLWSICDQRPDLARSTIDPD